MRFTPAACRGSSSSYLLIAIIATFFSRPSIGVIDCFNPTVLSQDTAHGRAAGP